MDLRHASLRDLAEQVRTRQLGAVELVQHSLDRIDALDGDVHAFTQVDGERALAAARDVDRRLAAGEDVGPLAGIPLAVKDLEDAEGFVTTYGSALHVADPPATRDSIVVRRLRRAGAVVVGKTNTPEFGFKGVTDNPAHGHTANPWDTTRSPGGSSGGSAAAIAAGMVPLATGSDGGGSIRIPSSLCGLSGLKTSQGRVPLGGSTAPGAGVLGVRGPMARRIRDVAWALDVCAGPDPTDIYAFPGPHEPWTPDLEGEVLPRSVAWSPTLGFAQVDREVAGAVEAAVRALADAGVEVIEVPAVFDRDPVLPWVHLWTAARARTQGHLRGTDDWERIDPELRAQIELGLSLTAVQHAEALDACHEINLRLDAAMEGADVLLCPTLAGQAPVLGRPGTVDGVEAPTWISFTPFLNMSRNPAGTVPVGTTADGLPIGMQVVGRQRDDLAVLRTVAAVEEVHPFEQVAAIG
ncbi:amidase [Actinomarinicola tropica]|uniref:Amidase n=1 Tax=Actinomarinicola tropica TaxID=2789776 RepID=A0A5Q2RH80_9ACTN|nr:amidase [Actinomarinicola tropica]QGG95113.1 amidase [Actinomarinicola tropica]